jgi:hypothetical protein
MTSPAIRVPWLRRALCLAGVALSLAGARRARAEEPTIDEVRYHPTELPPDGTRARVLLTGAALTAGWYGVGVGTSYLWPNARNARDLRIPVAGPWMALGDVGCGSKERNCRDAIVVVRTMIAVLSGVGQAGGLLAFAEGLFVNTGNVPSEAPGASPPQGAPPRTERPQSLKQSQRPSWAAVPVALPDGAAIEVIGHF